MVVGPARFAVDIVVSATAMQGVEAIAAVVNTSDATIAKIIEPYGMPIKLVHLVLVNGVYVPPELRATRTFVEGDVLAIWPPIGGG